MSTRRLMEELRSRQREEARHAASGPSRKASESPRTATAQASFVLPPPMAVQEPKLLEQLKTATPAKLGIGRAGLRYRTQTQLQFLVDVALAKAAVESQLPTGWAEAHELLPLQSVARDAEQFLLRPDLGRQLDAASLALVQSSCMRGPDVQIVVGDGLSAQAVMQNAPPMLRVLREELAAQGLQLGTPVCVRHCRAKLVDVIGQAVGAKIGIILLGERPGLGTGDGMSAYLVWEPCLERTDAERQVISNIHQRGLLPAEAGHVAARLVAAILAQRASGVKLDLRGLENAPSARNRINQAQAESGRGCGQSHGQCCGEAREGRPGRSCACSTCRPCEVSAHEAPR